MVFVYDPNGYFFGHLVQMSVPTHIADADGYKLPPEMPVHLLSNQCRLSLRSGTDVCSFVQPPNCRNSCNFCRKSGNFCRKLSAMGEKKLRKFKEWLFEKARKGRRSSEILPNFKKNLRSDDPENEIYSHNFGASRGGGSEIPAKIAEIRFFGLLRFLTANSLQKAL